MKTRNHPFLPLAAIAGLALATSAHAATLAGQLGILDVTANGGLNPATGAAWQAGETYRLVFVTSTTADTLSTAIGDYNTLVQNDADGSTLNLGSATWKVVGSTSSVAAIDNTGTRTGTGGAVFLVDGSTVVANDSNSTGAGGFWAAGHLAAINLDQNGNTRSVDVNVGSTNSGGEPNPNLSFGDEADGDHLPNGVEAWFGTHPDEFNAGLTGLATDATTTTFTHPQNENPPSDLSGFYQWSPNLIDWYAGDGGDGPGGGPTIMITPNTVGASTTVTATASEPLGQLFLRAAVVLN